MELNRTRFALEKTKAALDLLDEDRVLISNYFTEYVLVIFCSEMEEKIKFSLEKALQNNTSDDLTLFITNTLDTIFKRICKKDLAKTVRYFGEDKFNNFKSLIDDTTAQKYANFVSNRHSVAHPGSVNVSWQEIQTIADVGEAILSAFRTSLNIKMS